MALYIIVQNVSPDRNDFLFCAHPNQEVIDMSTIAPAVEAKFETLSTDLKNAILERNVQINTIHDLIHVLEIIVQEDN